MLSIFGILGAVFAGVLADGLMTHDKDDPEAQKPEADQDQADSSDGGDLLHDPSLPPSLPETEVDAPPPLTIGLVSAAPDSAGSEDGIRTDDTPPPLPLPVTVNGDDHDDLLQGTNAADHIFGGAGQDQINAKAGKDHLYGGADADIIWAGADDDTVFGADGDDLLHGEAGADRIFGGTGADALYGHAGHDSMAGGRGADSLIGGEGDDSLHGGGGSDWLAGGEGNDSLTGGPGTDTLDGGAGHDRLIGSDDTDGDFLNGGAGDDALWLGAGDQAHGGAGADSFTLSHWLDQAEAAHISDYNAEEDQLILVYDPMTHADPQLTIQPIAGQDAVSILLDGQLIATVNGAIDPADIQLMAA